MDKQDIAAENPVLPVKKKDACGIGRTRWRDTVEQGVYLVGPSKRQHRD